MAISFVIVKGFVEKVVELGHIVQPFVQVNEINEMKKLEDISYKYFDLQEGLFQSEVKEFNQLIPCSDKEIFYMVKSLLFLKDTGIIDIMEELNIPDEQYERMISILYENMPYKESKNAIELERRGFINFTDESIVEYARPLDNFIFKRVRKLTRDEGSLKKKINLLDKIIEG